MRGRHPHNHSQTQKSADTPALLASHVLAAQALLQSFKSPAPCLLRLCFTLPSRRRMKAARNRFLLRPPANQNTDATSNFRSPSLESVLVILFQASSKIVISGQRRRSGRAPALTPTLGKPEGVRDRAPSSPPAARARLCPATGERRDRRWSQGIPSGHTDPLH